MFREVRQDFYIKNTSVKAWYAIKWIKRKVYIRTDTGFSYVKNIYNIY